jgi:multidrug transporter EmrE-like cation transporter
VSSYFRVALCAVGQIPMSVQYAEWTAFTIQGVSVVVRVLCVTHRELGSGSVRSGLSLPHLLGAIVVLALGLLLAVVSLLIELCYRHVTAAPTVSLRCAS